MSIEARETFYRDTVFRSRIEARWAVFFDELEVEWIYEYRHFELGLKRTWDIEDQYEFREALDEAEDDDERDEIIRETWRRKNEQWMYLPDFYLPEFKHWVEIKGKPPTHGERTKARKLAYQTVKPVSILWGYIPDPNAKVWGECTEVYVGDMNIIAILVLEFGIEPMKRAFAAARRARF